MDKFFNSFKSIFLPYIHMCFEALKQSNQPSLRSSLSLSFSRDSHSPPLFHSYQNQSCKDMKRIDIFCASQASTAICMSMDQPSSSFCTPSSSSSIIELGGRAIDRHNPIIRDHKRIPRAIPVAAPCIASQSPINPQPYHLLHRTKKGSAKSTEANEKCKKVSAKPKDQKSKKHFLESNDETSIRSASAKDIVRRSWIESVDFITPPGSSRYLLGDKACFDGLPDYDPVFSLTPAESNKAQALNQEQSTAASKSSSSSPSERPSNQVVVLRVSLHCKGCEGKVRKHLSRMEGVTSFSIDFAAKKVTIVGDVTPLGVLSSVSKVKNAQFWTTATAPTPASDNKEIKN